MYTALCRQPHFYPHPPHKTHTHLGHHKLVKADIIGQRHAAGVDLEDAPLGLGVWQRELDLAVDAPGADERRVERLDAIGGHYHLCHRWWGWGLSVWAVGGV